MQKVFLFQFLNGVFAGANEVDLAVALGNFGHHCFVCVESAVNNLDFLACFLLVILFKKRDIGGIDIVRPVIYDKFFFFPVKVHDDDACNRTADDNRDNNRHDKDFNCFLVHALTSFFLSALAFLTLTTLTTRMVVSTTMKIMLNIANQNGESPCTLASA